VNPWYYGYILALIIFILMSALIVGIVAMANRANRRGDAEVEKELEEPKTSMERSKS